MASVCVEKNLCMSMEKHFSSSHKDQAWWTLYVYDGFFILCRIDIILPEEWHPFLILWALVSERGIKKVAVACYNKRKTFHWAGLGSHQNDIWLGKMWSSKNLSWKKCVSHSLCLCLVSTTKNNLWPWHYVSEHHLTLKPKHGSKISNQSDPSPWTWEGGKYTVSMEKYVAAILEPQSSCGKAELCSALHTGRRKHLQTV